MRAKRKHPECAALEPPLVAYVCGDPHPGVPSLVTHLLRCEDCRREVADLRAVEVAVERALASAPAPSIAGAPGGRRASPGDASPRMAPLWLGGRFPAWLATRAAPAAAAALIACVLLLGNAGGPAPDPCAPRPASIFGEPAAAGVRSFDGGELDGRLDWISFQLKRLGGDPW